MTGVSECPSNANENEKRATEICSKACGNSKGDINYKYHCMPDSTRKYLIEMCAIPEYLFGNELFSFFSIYYIKYCFRIICTKSCMHTVNILILLRIQHLKILLRKFHHLCNTMFKRRWKNLAGIMLKNSMYHNIIVS